MEDRSRGVSRLKTMVDHTLKNIGKWRFFIFLYFLGSCVKNEALTLPDRKSVFGFTYLPEKKMFVFSIVSVVSISRYIIYKNIKYILKIAWEVRHSVSQNTERERACHPGLIYRTNWACLYEVICLLLSRILTGCSSLSQKYKSSAVFVVSSFNPKCLGLDLNWTDTDDKS